VVSEAVVSRARHVGRGGDVHLQSKGVRTRVASAWLVFAVTLLGVVWLLTYQVGRLFEYIEYLDDGRIRHHFNPSQRVGEQPWWTVPAAVALVLIGTALILWLLPERRRLVRRHVDRFAKPS
jgi:hypothetical protein